MQYWKDFVYFAQTNPNNHYNMVYLHGYSGGVKNKYFLLDHLQNTNYYGFNFPGHDLGEKNFSEKRFNLAYITDLIVQFILDFDLHNVVLYGHSFGGGLAILIANDPRLKTRLQKIILETPANPTSNLRYTWLKQLLKPKTLAAMELLTNELFYNPLQFFQSQKYLEMFWEKELAHLQSISRIEILLEHHFFAAFNEAISDAIGKNKWPTLTLLGEYDLIIPTIPTKTLFQSFQNYQIEIIPNTKHVPVLEAKETTIPLLNRYINS